MGLPIGDILSILSPAFGMGYKGAQDANNQARRAEGRARTGADMYQAMENIYAPWYGRGWTGAFGSPGPVGPGSKLAATQGRGGGGGMPMPGMGGGGMGGGGGMPGGMPGMPPGPGAGAGMEQLIQQMIQRRMGGR